MWSWKVFVFDEKCPFWIFNPFLNNFSRQRALSLTQFYGTPFKVGCGANIDIENVYCDGKTRNEGKVMKVQLKQSVKMVMLSISKRMYGMGSLLRLPVTLSKTFSWPLWRSLRKWIWKYEPSRIPWESFWSISVMTQSFTPQLSGPMDLAYHFLFDFDGDFVCRWRVDDDNCIFVHCEDFKFLLIDPSVAVHNTSEWGLQYSMKRRFFRQSTFWNVGALWGEFSVLILSGAFTRSLFVGIWTTV